MSWRTQDNYSIGGFCLKLKLTDSPGIAGGFYWIHQKKLQTLMNKGLQRCSLASMRGFEPPTPRLGDGPSAYIPYQQG